MSVDTYLKGKRIDGNYSRHRAGEVEVLVANTLTRWGTRLTLDAPWFILGRRLKPQVEHEHHPT